MLRNPFKRNHVTSTHRPPPKDMGPTCERHGALTNVGNGLYRCRLGCGTTYQG